MLLISKIVCVKFLINLRKLFGYDANIFTNFIFIITTITTIVIRNGINCTDCGSPAIPLNSKLKHIINQSNILEATYECDSGYEMFGSPKIECKIEKGWSKKLPFCGVNVAYRKPANQSSFTRNGPPYLANDGNSNPEDGMCAETQKEPAPWWQVDLLIPQAIRVVRITTKSCCEHNLLQDMEIRVGNSTADPQRNQLCAWHPGALEEEMTKTFICARPLIGQYVIIQSVGTAGTLSLCEVEAFSSDEFSHQRCNRLLPKSGIVTNVFLNTCYDFYLKEGLSFERAQQTCTSYNNGNLVNNLHDSKTNFITSELDRRKSELQTNLVWIGAQKEPGITTRIWKWINGEVVTKPTWGKDQPNNYNGEQNCVVFDGGRNWLWNDVGCNLDYLHFICQYAPNTCGSPDLNINSVIVEKNFTVGNNITYICDNEYALIGDANRECTKMGLWTKKAPTCIYVDCGPLNSPGNGSVSFSEKKTTFGVVANYKCNENYTLIGTESRKCVESGWTGKDPKCITDWCTEPQSITGGKISMIGQKAGSVAKYECNAGYILIGNSVISCELGGKWSNEPPYCKYVDCGTPARPDRGNVNLINGTTIVGSAAKYTCDEDHWIIGNEEINCTENGKWSGNVPTCELITCETPFVPTGSFVVGYDYNIHSTIQYNCDPGYILRGEKTIECLPNGEWSETAPFCDYIDCGILTPIKHGTIKYANNSTFLGSVVHFTCSNNYNVKGISKRECLESGSWSGESPKCEEIRCPEPILAAHSILSITGNDRMYGRTLIKTADSTSSSSQSFKISSLAKYRCERGYKVVGDPLITCKENGQWSGLIPECIFIDCEAPPPLVNGKVVLATNATYYGAAAHYDCLGNFNLNGVSRRLCLHNGSWSHDAPICAEISCNEPTDFDKFIIDIESNKIGSKAIYNCLKGSVLIGNNTRTCLKTGKWSGKSPLCKTIDCKSPPKIDNGRLIIINDSTLYGGSAEYHCIPNYNRVGPYLRKCLDNGSWSGELPRCELIVPEGNDGASIGAAVAIGSIIIILLLITIAILFFHRNKTRPVKNTENVQAAEYVQDRNVAVVSYSNLETTNQSIGRPNIGFQIADKGSENMYDQIPNEITYDSPYEMRTNEEVYEPEPQIANNLITINGISVR